MTRTSAALGLAAVTILAIAWWGSESEAEARLRLLARAVCEPMSPSAQANLVERLVSPEVFVAVSQPDWSGGRREAQALLSTSSRAFPGCDLELDALEVTSSGGGEHRVRGRARWSASQASDLHARVRSFLAQWRTVDGQPVLVRLVVDAPQRQVPEPRP